MIEPNLEAEQAVIGGLLLLGDPKSPQVQSVLATLKPESFSSRQHRIYYNAIASLFQRGQNVDLITVEVELKKQGNNEPNDFVYLAQVMKSTPSAANLAAYSRLVREDSIGRFANSKMNEVLATINDPTVGDIYQRLGMAETYISQMLNLALKNKASGLRPIGEFASDWLDKLDQRIEDGEDVDKLTTGLDSLDDVLGVKCLRRGSLVALGARPKMGKTALMALMTNHYSIELAHGVSVFSLEMPGEQIFERSLTTDSTLNPDVFYDPRLINDEVNAKMHQSFSRIINTNLTVDDSTAIGLSHIQREVRYQHKQNLVSLVAVDYLTLMEAEKADRNDLAYGMITKGLKNLAKELNCVVLLLTQLNRGLEQRTNKRPLPSDSRDTGQIEQDCDVWIGMYKESAYNEDVQHPGLTEIIARYNRHGATGTAYAYMNQGFLSSVSNQEAARMLNDRHADDGDNGFKYKKK